MFERNIQRLLDRLQLQQAWTDVLQWAEHWIAFGQTPEPAYRALMIAYGAQGDLAAVALVLGAAGVNVGTRFLASEEAPVSQLWKQMIVDAASENAVKFDAWNDIMPPSRSGGYETSL
jgi:hypothetical protein